MKGSIAKGVSLVKGQVGQLSLLILKPLHCVESGHLVSCCVLGFPKDFCSLVWNSVVAPLS